MTPVAELISLQEAQALIVARVQPLASEPVALDHAVGRVLAEPARALVDLPPFRSSAMDGYAVRSADTPGTLPVAFRIAAGLPAPRPLEAGEAMAIATGGGVPDGAKPVASGANVRAVGGDVVAGGLVIEAGARRGPAQIGALAAAGIAEVVCARRPRATVLTTGTEKPGATSSLVLIRFLRVRFFQPYLAIPTP